MQIEISTSETGNRKRQVRWVEGRGNYGHTCILSTGIGIGRAERKKRSNHPVHLKFYPSYLIVPSLFGLGFCEDEDEEDED